MNLQCDTGTCLSREGFDKLQSRLQELQAERQALRGRVGELRQSSDDDFDLVDEMQQLTFLEKEIITTQRVINQAKILEVTDKDGTIKVGSIVQLRADDRKELRCMLVNSLEADPIEG